MSDLKAQAKLEALWDREPPFPSIPALKDLRLLEHQEFNVHELYVRPPSFGVTCIWYRHHTNRFTSVWEWTPYDPYFEVEAVTSRWIPVTQMTVKEGRWKGARPVEANRIIIEALADPEIQAHLCNVLVDTTGRISLPGDRGHAILAQKNESTQFVTTNASASVQLLLEDIKAGWWKPQRPVVIAQYGAPGTGKSDGVRKFAEQLRAHLETTEPHVPPFQKFYRSHNFATMTTKESISRFMGASKGYEGGKGDLVSDIENGARVFHLDEFHLADPTIIKAFGGVFEDGEVTDNSGAHAVCPSPTFFFLSCNFWDAENKQQTQADRILSIPAFHDEDVQSRTRNEKVQAELDVLRGLMFQGTMAFIGDRVRDSLLTYQPQTKTFRAQIVSKFLADAVVNNIRTPDNLLAICWKHSVVQYYASWARTSNRQCRSLISKHVLDVVRELPKDKTRGLLVLSVAPASHSSSKKSSVLTGELLEWTDELKKDVESQMAPALLVSPEKLKDVEKARKHLSKLKSAASDTSDPISTGQFQGGGMKTKPKAAPVVETTTDQAGEADQPQEEKPGPPPPVDLRSLSFGMVLCFGVLLFSMLLQVIATGLGLR